MVISDSPQENLAPKVDNFTNSGLRRRPSGKTAVDADISAVADYASDNNASIPGDSLDNSTEASSTDASSDGDAQSPIRNHSGVANGEGERVAKGGDRAGDADIPVRFTYRPSMPAHRRVKESPLSSDAIFRQSHAGLFNLCIVVLVAVNSRLIIENLMKYGLLIRAGFWFSSKSLRDWPLLMCCISLSILPLLAFVVDKMAQHKFISEPVVVSLHMVITTSNILYPVLVILRHDPAVQSGVALMLIACILWLKLVSFAHTNYDIRALSKSTDKGDTPFSTPNPDDSYNVSIKRLTYFMVAPTLCYQPSYPRTTSIRKGWVIRQVIKLVIFTGLMGFMIEQYINPIVKNSQHPLNGDFLNAIERVLKLSVPTLYVWLCMFYCFFHLWLNILGELLRFGDREFYKDWWNAKTIEEYWRMWNMPVHKWMVRHVYFPCLRNGIPKGVAIIVAFFVSAVFHELCIGVPCHIFKFWAFIGIMFQVPLVIFTNCIQNKFKNTMVGNMIFWFFFSILGQPMCVLLYYHDLMNRKGRME